MPLTEKQSRFIHEYLVDGNATQAAIRAGYRAGNAKAQGNENLTKPDIKAALDRARLSLAERTGISAERVVEES